MGAFVLALIGRAEQRRLNKQIEHLRHMVFKLQAQPPAKPVPLRKQDRHTTAQPGAGVGIRPAQPTPPKPIEEVDVVALDEVPAPPPETPTATKKPDTVFTDALDEVMPKRDKVPKPAETDHPPLHAAPTAQPPQTDKKQTLQRLTSAQHAEPKRPPFAPPTVTQPSTKPAPKPKTKPKPVSLEERLGAGVYIWIGGIALMLAGAFLVKYSFDNNLLSVSARLSLAGGFGAVLVLASLWLHKRADKVAAAVCGAGVADLFATVLAATAYFKIMDPWWGFALMALVTAVAIGMSLKHGPFVALLGLIGGFATPTLISGTESAWGPMFTYLLLLEIGLTVVTRKKQWFGLSALTLLASVLSALAYTVFAWNPDSRYWLMFFVLGSAVVFVANAARSTEQEEGCPSILRRIWLGLGAVGTSALLMTMLVAYSGFSTIELAALGLLSAGALVLARLDRRYITLAYLGAGLCGMMLLAWPASNKVMEVVLDLLSRSTADRVAEVALEPSRYYQIAIGYGLVFFVGGLLCLWRNARPGMFAWLSAGSALAFVILPHIGQVHHLPDPLRWWMVYTAVAALVSIAAALVWRTREHHGTLIIDAYTIMAAALATLAIVFGLDHPWVAPAWCGLAVVVAALGMRLHLRWLVIPTGWLTVGCVSQLIYPGVFDYDMPMRLIANTMLAHYGLPAMGFAAIAWIYHRDPWQPLRTVFQALALVTATVAISLQFRLGFHPEELWHGPTELVEWSTYAALWMAIGAGVLWRFKAPSLDGLRKAAVGIGVVGLITVVLYPLLIGNPLLKSAVVGDTVVLNWLLYIYGLPCVLAFLLARAMPKEAGPFKRAAEVVSFVLMFALVTLEVRHGFTGQDTQWRMQSDVGLHEWATYSVAWVVISLALLWLGRRVESRSLGIAALVTGMAGLGAAVLGPLVIDNPLFQSAGVGELRVFNWLLYIYGLPCVLAFVLTRMLPDKAGIYKQIAVAASFVLLFALMSMEVRHGFTGANTQWRPHNRVVLHEWATYSVIWLVLSLVMSWIGTRWRARRFEWAGVVMGLAGFTAAVVGTVGLSNPMFSTADVGALRGLNWLLYIYGLPCLLVAAVAYTSRVKEVPMKPIAVAVSLLLLLVFVSLEVRQGFVGSNLRLDTHPITSAENYSYSLAWVLLALSLLAGGLVTGSPALRYGSLAVMLVAVGKVAVDTAQLRDLWRVLSLLGLGLSLIVLGYVYQRYVFRRPKQSDTEQDEPVAWQDGE
jgi:uncharacterized membrane protein